MKQTKVVLIILCSIHFWGYVGINPSLFKLTNVASLGVMGFSLFRTINSNNNLRFKWAIFLYLIGIIANFLSANINNGQGMKDTILSGFNFYFIILYFFLHDEKIEKKDLETIVIVLGVLYALFYLRQVAVFPKRLFAGNMFEDRGTIRIRIEGSGFMMLAYFMLLNRYLLQRKVWQVLLALLFFVVLLKSGFRTLTAGAILLSGVTFLVFVKYSLVNYLMIVLAVALFLGLLQFGSTAVIVDNMIKATEEQQEQGENYIRRLQYEYFTQVYPQNFSYYIFGGGLPGAYGPYANQMSQLIQLYGFYWVDLGLIGFYFVVGLIALLGILFYVLRGIFIKIPPEYFYLHMFLAYLLLVSITTMEIYRDGMFPVQAIALYIIDLGRDEWLGIGRKKRNNKSVSSSEATTENALRQLNE